MIINKKGKSWWKAFFFGNQVITKGKKIFNRRKGSRENGYYFDITNQDNMRKSALKADYKENVILVQNSGLKSSNDLIEKRGLVLIKIPKTGTQTFVFSTKKFFEFSQSNEVMTNYLCWKLWPNLFMLPRINNNSPWIVGGKTFIPEQLLMIEHHFALLHPEERKALMERPLGKNKFKILMSHWPWHYNPSIYERIMISEKPFTVTILRDPARRAISSYFYNLKRQGFDQSKTSIDEFEQFLQEDYDEDFYCRWFSYPSSIDEPKYENAIYNLRNTIDIVGITERYDNFIKILNKKCGFNYEEGVVINKGNYESFSYEDLPSNTLKLLLEKTKKDRRLYDVAIERFENDCRNILNI